MCRGSNSVKFHIDRSMIKAVFLVLILSVVSIFCSCAERGNSDTYRLHTEMLGTWINVIATVDQNIDCEELNDRVAGIDKQMRSELSLFDNMSLLNRFNRGEEVTPSRWMLYNVKLADSISRLSNGVYDITIAPLVKANGFARKEESIERINVDSIMEFVGYKRLIITDDNIIKSDPRMQIDLNSIAKGFTVDLVAQLLEEYGVESYMVEIGGELRVKGVNLQGDAWRVGIETPSMGNFIGGSVTQRVAIPDSSRYKSVATSGNYRRFHTNAEGKRVVHTIDPLSGKPYESTLLSATVLAENCALADGYATMFMAAGDRGAIELSQRVENCEVLFIFSRENCADDGEYDIYSSDGMKLFLME
ncbi:MAG: FAD:protein FMN transferase [Rikenellaceae bacterium]